MSTPAEALEQATQPRPIEEIREAFNRVHRVATNQPGARAYMSIPSRPEHDADFIVHAAIDELEQLRTELPSLLEDFEMLGQIVCGIVFDVERDRTEKEATSICSFCNTISQRTEMAAHMLVCTKHPMHQLQIEIEQLRGAHQAEMVGAFGRFDVLLADSCRREEAARAELAAAVAQKEITEAEYLAGLEFATETVRALTEECDAAQARVKELEAFGAKVNVIRNSIVGMQGFNFSEHAYPLVAALDDAGFEGDGYELAAENLGTLIEQIKASETREKRLADLLTECLTSKWATSNDWQDRARAALSDPKPRPPVACSSCSTPIAKFIEPGWHPCRDCDGALCEKCCDAKKARPA